MEQREVCRLLEKNHTFSKDDVTFLVKKGGDAKITKKSKVEKEAYFLNLAKGDDIWKGELLYLHLYTSVVHVIIQPLYL